MCNVQKYVPHDQQQQQKALSHSLPFPSPSSTFPFPPSAPLFFFSSQRPDECSKAALVLPVPRPAPGLVEGVLCTAVTSTTSSSLLSIDCAAYRTALMAPGLSSTQRATRRRRPILQQSLLLLFQSSSSYYAAKTQKKEKK